MGDFENKENLLVVAEKAIFGPNMPFEIGYNQMLYVEPGWNPDINGYLAANAGKTDGIVYLPNEARHLGEILHYHFPNADADILDTVPLPLQEIYNTIISLRTDIAAWQPQAPFLMRKEKDGSHTVFPLWYGGDAAFGRLLGQVKEYPRPQSNVRQSSTTEDNIFNSSIKETHNRDPRNRADNCSIDDIAQEINDRIQKLQMMGVSDYLIRQMIKLPEPKLSQLVITNDYRILLPAYGNMEIEMPTLSKVVYFFYLRHPEGLCFKDLVLYRDELLQIYYRLSTRTDLDKMEQSIDELIDTTRNSINEKVSRIRAAFVSQFDDSLARNYYITRGHGFLKTITLDRLMVIDQSGTLKIWNEQMLNRTFTICEPDKDNNND